MSNEDSSMWKVYYKKEDNRPVNANSARAQKVETGTSEKEDSTGQNNSHNLRKRGNSVEANSARAQKVETENPKQKEVLENRYKEETSLSIEHDAEVNGARALKIDAEALKEEEQRSKKDSLKKEKATSEEANSARAQKVDADGAKSYEEQRNREYASETKKAEWQ